MSSRRSFIAIVSSALVAGVLAFSPAAGAAPGDLDPGFGTGGVLTGYPGNAGGIATDNDGKIYLVSTYGTEDSGTLTLSRYSSTGILDTTFSGDGKVELVTPTGVSGLVAVDSSNRPVVAASYYANDSSYQLWRFTTTGAPDTTFSGDGAVAIPIDPAGHPDLSGLGFQPDGDIILGINELWPLGGLSQFPQFTRVTSAGVVMQTVDVLDDSTESFAGGRATTKVDGSGRVYVLVPDDGKLNLRRYTEALAVDSSYSGDGLVSVGRPGGSGDHENWGTGLAVTSSGVAYVSGTVGTHTGMLPTGPGLIDQKAILLARLTSAGALDTGFSGDGITLPAIPAGVDVYDTSPQAIELAAGDHPVLVGGQSGGGAGSIALLWQFTLAGAPDVAFSGDGRVEDTSGWWSSGTAIAQSGSRLLLTNFGDVRSFELAVPAPATVPGKPAAPTVVAGDGQVKVSWIAPATDGGSPITGYMITPYIGGIAQSAVNVGASPTSKVVTGLTNGTAYTFTVSAKNVVGTGTPSASSPAVTPSAAPSGPAGSVFVAVAPCRVADTRNGGGALASGATRAFQVSGSGSGFAAQGGKSNGCGIPTAAVATEASVTAVAPVGNGFFRAWGSGGPAATATFLNFTKNQGITNTGAIGLGSGTKDLTTKNFGAAAHYVIDVQGYFVEPADVPATATGAVFVAVAPCRVADTRNGGGALASGATRAFQVSGAGGGFAAQGGKANGCAIPTDAVAVEASVTAVAPAGSGFFRAWGSGGPAATATFLNFTKNQGITNTGAIGLGSGTKDLTTKNFGASAHYVIDVQGYFVASAPVSSE